MWSADRIGVGIGMGIGQTRGLSLHANLASVRYANISKEDFWDYIKKRVDLHASLRRMQV